MRRGAAWIFASTFWATSSQAQTSIEGGPGVPLGEKSRLHANLDVGVGFDSNPDRFDDDTSDARSDWRALARPGLKLSVPGSAVSLGMSAQASLLRYFGVGQQGDTTAGGAFELEFAAGSKRSFMTLRVQDQLVRTPAFLDRPGAGASDERRFKEWFNRGRAELTFRPGGRALEISAGYLNILSFYDADGLPASQQHGAFLEGKLKFLPKTAVVLRGDFSVFDPQDEVSTRVSSPYTVSLSLIGQITTRLSAHLGAGFGDTLTWESGLFSDVASANQRTVIGNAELSYALADSAQVSVGYRRALHPVILLDSYRSDAPVARAQIGVGRWIFTLFAEYEFRSYARADRNVRLFTGDARAEFWFLDFLMTAVNYRLLAQRPDSGNPPLGSMSSALFLEDFTRHQGTLLVGLRY